MVYLKYCTTALLLVCLWYLLKLTYCVQLYIFMYCPQYVPIWDIPGAKSSCGPLEMLHRAPNLHCTSCYVTINGVKALAALRCGSQYVIYSWHFT